MSQSKINPPETRYDDLDSTEWENLRRYGSQILELIAKKHQTKMEGPAVVSAVSESVPEIAAQIGAPKQVTGRTLTALVKSHPSVSKASRSYRFAVDAIPHLREELKEIADLNPRKAETAAILRIIELYGPITGREIRPVLTEWLGYELSESQIRARIAQIDCLHTVPGKGGFFAEPSGQFRMGKES